MERQNASRRGLNALIALCVSCKGEKPFCPALNGAIWMNLETGTTVGKEGDSVGGISLTNSLFRPETALENRHSRSLLLLPVNALENLKVIDRHPATFVKPACLI